MVLPHLGAVAPGQSNLLDRASGDTCVQDHTLVAGALLAAPSLSLLCPPVGLAGCEGGTAPHS